MHYYANYFCTHNNIYKTNEKTHKFLAKLQNNFATACDICYVILLHKTILSD